MPAVGSAKAGGRARGASRARGEGEITNYDFGGTFGEEAGLPAAGSAKAGCHFVFPSRPCCSKAPASALRPLVDWSLGPVEAYPLLQPRARASEGGSFWLTLRGKTRLRRAAKGKTYDRMAGNSPGYIG